MSATNDFAIRTEGLGRRYGGNWAVRNLDLEVPRGAVYGFLGLNGAGKSTTMRMLMGLLTPHEGHAEVLGIDPRRDPAGVRRRVGYVPEKTTYYDWMSVREVMAFVAHYRRGEWDDRRAGELATLFKLPLDQKLKSLSKGQYAKVGLLLALAFDPAVLILDEPTGGLDPVVRREFVESLLGQYTEGDRTVLISSHLINEISGIVDYVGILKDGRLIRSEPAEKLRSEVKRVRLLYPDAPPRALNLPGTLSMRIEEREAVLILDGFDEKETPGLLSKLGAEHVSVEELSLENIFVEITTAEEMAPAS